MSERIPPLEKLNPAEAWQPWQPTADDPWGKKWAAHLYRRAAFGAGRQTLEEAERVGPDRTLNLLLRGEAHSEETRQSLADVGRIAAKHDDGGQQLSGWWLYCMLQTGHPLREKLTLFWHNHFATSIAKVHSARLMFEQNCLLRKDALGKFGDLLQEISRDGAMLIWLDSNSNVKGRPNENYARELMELFSLGVANYSEKDIREAARAFTGWHIHNERYRFDARLHDDGPKTVLGQTGTWNGDDIVRIILKQTAVARFLVRKLYQFFISDAAVPPDALLEPLCDAFRRSAYDIAELVRTMLASRHFYSAYAFRQRVKSPVEFVLGAALAVYRRYAEGDPNFRPLPQKVLAKWLGPMGQQLFAPPNVKGWPGGRYWLNSATLLERANFAAALATGDLWVHSAVGQTPVAGPWENFDGPDLPAAWDAARAEREQGSRRPDETVNALLDLYLPGEVRSAARAKLVPFVAEGTPSGAALDRRVREAVHAIMMMPEYQLA
jgi:uncharacterized protein (DUF1800 family)